MKSFFLVPSPSTFSLIEAYTQQVLHVRCGGNAVLKGCQSKGLYDAQHSDVVFCETMALSLEKLKERPADLRRRQKGRAESSDLKKQRSNLNQSPQDSK